MALRRFTLQKIIGVTLVVILLSTYFLKPKSRKTVRAQNPSRVVKMERNSQTRVTQEQNIVAPQVDDSKSKLPPRDEEQSKLPPRDEAHSKLLPGDEAQSKLPPGDEAQSKLPPVDEAQSKLPPGDEAQSKLPPGDEAQNKAPSGDSLSSVPCGQVCDYSIRKKEGDTFLRKEFNCKNIFHRLKYPPGKVYKPPLNTIPPELLQEFTQYGALNLRYKYSDQAHAVNKVSYTSAEIKELLLNDTNKMIGAYGASSDKFRDVLRKYKGEIEGKSGIVIGSQSPWLEVMLINLGVKHVTTVDYNPLSFDHPKLSFKLVPDFADEINKDQSRQMDFAASFSSLEHSGLGRYGDPLNPYGDLEAAAQIWCMLKPGAYFFLGLPSAFGYKNGTLVFNAHREYGEARVEQISANFEEIGRAPAKQHGILILRKPLK